MKNLLRITFIFLLILSLVTNVYSSTNVVKKSTEQYRKGRLWVRIIPEASPNEVFSSYSVAERILLPHQSILFQQYQFQYSKEFTKRRAEIIKAEEPLLRTYIIEWKDFRTNEEVVQYLYATKKVESVSYDFIPKRHSVASLPNDPLLNQQEYLNTMNVKDAWNVYEGSPNVIVAIIDAGAVQDHPDIKDNIAINQAEIPNNGIDDDANGYIDDYNGYNFAAMFEPSKEWGNTFNSNNHGQVVSGIVGATPNNSIGIAGVGNKSKIFPLKVFTISTDEEFFGYQALVYTALQNFQVANCSWGIGGNRSEIFQSIIDFCVARNVAIVAAAGNESTFTELTYPACYFGVLGVGETDVSDALIPTSSLGQNLGVMAPGYRSFSTGNIGYVSENNGTSFASPMVAGVVALIRGKYPELTAIEALEHARNSVDLIYDKNIFDAPYIGGRINALKAVSNIPFAMPGLRPIEEPVYRNTMGNIVTNYKNGDTVDVRIRVKNFLGAGTAIQCSLTIPDNFIGDLTLLESEITLQSIERNDEIDLGPFRFIVNDKSNNAYIFRIDFNDQKGYSNFTHFTFVNQKPYHIIENDSIAYSLFENGRIGYDIFDSEKIGVGFGVKPFATILESAGLLYCAGVNPQTTSIGYSNDDPLNRYEVVKNVKSGDNSFSVLKKDGVEIQVTAKPYSNTSTLTRHSIKLKNTNSATVAYPSVGYFADWDLGRRGSGNSVSTFQEAIVELPHQNYAIKINRTNTSNVIGMALSTKEGNVTFSATGGVFQIMDNSIIYSSLRNGNQIINSFVGDVVSSLGITFDDGLAAGAEKECFICMGMSHDEESLAQKLKECISSTLVSVQEKNDIVTMQVFPNPSKNNINVLVNGQGLLIVRTLSGKEVLSLQIENSSKINTNSLPNGMYIFEYTSNKNERQSTLVAITR